MPEATQILRQEHDAILKILDVAEDAVRRIEGGGRIRRETLSGMSEFLRLFADLCHDAKEESLLFPALERHGMLRAGGPISAIIQEHEEARTLVRCMAEAAEASHWGDDSQRKWAAAARTYIDLLRLHISKENNLLFAVAEGMLSSREQQDLAAQFPAVELEKLGPGRREQLDAMRDQLIGELQKPEEATF